MRTFGKWLGRLLLALVVAAIAVGLWKREEITRLLAVNSLFSAEKIVQNFSNMDTAFLNTPVSRGNGPMVDLPYGPDTALPDDVDTWITERSVTSLLVMKNGQIVYENYFLGTGPEDRRIGWSVAKSYLSALVGVLIAEGALPSIDVAVTDYAPQLKGGAYDGARLRDVLQMSSGVVFGEDILDPNSDLNRMGRILALGGKMDDFAAGLKDTYAEAGQEWKYTSIDTHIISMVVRGATGRSIPDLLSEKIVAPLGLEYSPYYITDGAGTAFVLGGLNITTRDYARFGQMFAQGGTWQGRQIVPQDWVRASTLPSARTKDGEIGYGYQWWIPQGSPAGTYLARGIYGQYIYVDTAAQVVIVTTAADRNFKDEGVEDYNVEIFRMITNSL